MSNTIDVMEAEEVVRKGVVPKGYGFHSCIAWAYDEESYDCHLRRHRWSAADD